MENLPQLCAQTMRRNHRIKETAMTRVTLALATAAVIALIDARPASAGRYEGPWCAYMATGFDYYVSRCDLPNYEACRNEIMATPGTWCTENPRYQGPSASPSRTKRRQPRY